MKIAETIRAIAGMPWELSRLAFEIKKLRDEVLDLRRAVQQSGNRLVPVLEACGRIHDAQVRAHPPASLAEAEFRVFSQWGEDGIISRLVELLPEMPQTFVEFGVENYQEANTRWLLRNRNWSGLVMDGSDAHVAAIRADPIYWKHNLKARAAFITAENINDLLREEGMTGRIGLLSIDIDGVDYWVWKAINCIDPDLVVIEYNALFGPERAVTVPYDPAFRRQVAHYSTSYYGASLAALASLGREKGYALVGSNSAGNNAFFVRRELVRPPLKEMTAAQAWVKRRFREARNLDGSLALPSFEEEQRLIADCPVVEVGC